MSEEVRKLLEEAEWRLSCAMNDNNMAGDDLKAGDREHAALRVSEAQRSTTHAYYLAVKALILSQQDEKAEVMREEEEAQFPATAIPPNPFGKKKP